MLISMKLISMKNTKNTKNKKRGLPRFRVIAGLLCVCVGILVSSAAMSGAWMVVYNESMLKVPFPVVEEEPGEEIDLELAMASLEEDWETLDEDAEALLEEEAGELEEEETGDVEEDEADLLDDESDNDGTEDIDDTDTDSAAGETDAAGDENVEADAEAADDAVYEVWSYDDTSGFDGEDDSE